MPDDLTIVAQWAKSSGGAPADVYNAACRMLDQPAPERTPPDDTTEGPRERWRNGRSVGRTIYRMTGSVASTDDVLIGVMDTPELAVRVVASVTAQTAQDRSAHAVLAQTLLDLPRVLHAERTRRGLSVREAAAEIGCSFSTVSRLEAGLINTSVRGAIAVLWWLNGEEADRG